MGALGAVTAHASGCNGVTAQFDYGDATAADTVPVSGGAADSAHTYAANGTYTIGATSGDSTPGTTTATVADLGAEAAAAGFDPADHTVAEVQAYVTAHPDSLLDVLEAEESGKARTTLLGWLEAEDG